MERAYRAITLTVLGFLLSVAPAFGQSPSAPPTPTELPRGVRPLHYDIELDPKPEALSFNGKVRIALEILQPTSTLTLHALDLRFTRTRLTSRQDQRPRTPTVRIDADRQTASLDFDQALAIGQYDLVIDYSGTIITNPAGLFAIDYDSSERRKRALYTQLAIADARRVFPSWDEPEYKATFTLTTLVPSGLIPVSNMPVAQRTDIAAGRSRVTFERTPKMSTYLLFFALGEFDRATMKVGNTELGVVTRKGASAQAAFALESSARVLREFNDYFDVPYPLPKLDNIAGPGRSQAFAAMENWGAIFSFEYVLLLDPTISTQLDKQNTFEIAAHEIAHQWFGNLVTMRWWDDLWLNEGFASWLESRTTQRLHPEWNTKLNGVNTREMAMVRDSLVTTHPIVQPIATVNAANQAFDAITYSKGRAVLMMLEGYVGEDAWREGVRRYIKRNLYGSTVSDDLWREIEAASRQPIRAIAHDFTLQPGVPLIRVREPVCRDGRTIAQLTQAEFSRDQPNKTPLKWRVPVIAQSMDASTVTRRVLDTGSAEIEIAGCAPVIINAGQSGYYRTLYSAQHFDTIASRFADVAPIDQLGLLSDSWALGLAGHQRSTDFLTLASALPLEADAQIWGKIVNVFGELDEYYRIDRTRQAKFRQYARARLAPLLARIGWMPRDNESDPVAVLRNRLIATLGTLADPGVVAEARRRYAAQSTDPQAIPASLRKTILTVVAQHADETTWSSVRATAAAEKTPLVKTQLYTMLALAEDESLARRALDLALTPEPGATNSPEMIAAVAWKHPDLAFEFAMAHLPQVHEMLDPFARIGFVPSLGWNSNRPDMIEKIDRYASEHLPADSRSRANATIANIRDRARVQRERLPEIDAWITKIQLR